MKHLLTLTLSALLLASCGNKEAEGDKRMGKPDPEDAKPDKTTGYTVSDDVIKNPCELISADMVADHFNIDASHLEKEANNVGDHGSYKSTVYMNSCVYTWPRENAAEIEAEIAKKTQEMMINAGKTGKVDIGEAMKMKSPNYTVGISAVKVYDEGEDYQKLFDQSHRNMNDAEKAEHTEDISEGTGETGEEVTGAMMKELNFTTVEGVGDAAAWDHLGGALDVLIGNFQFSVQVNYSYEDNQKNIDMAKAIAEDILESL